MNRTANPCKELSTKQSAMRFLLDKEDVKNHKVFTSTSRLKMSQSDVNNLVNMLVCNAHSTLFQRCPLPH
ncbi:hypothetical protein HBI70_152730 [Parastagonospora nodorum]|nr:hypothetical protein HBH51_045770 [Parastagonospora nodorum]KAH4069914.1 hypothetical protein HBH50_106150 [Parastagonospora nodorum]KAH4090321.1 hypothetical protein HBH48_109920 [Parastagonospora nodorum]KAH5099151.1 hypothetical protein HBH71_237100 [Parastagonospora nodorum]KAH5264175.1 hypothetical protein HBI70_152730 [Parastagonospora nodorum]